MNRLENVVGIATGSTKGIGTGVAERLATEGTSVVVASDGAAYVSGSTITVDNGRTAVFPDDYMPNYREQR